jgi:4-diphosphocytidyl-2-C-methyl-D-erythritol kinase
VNAPAKLNLCLYLGPVREDGLHELCSIFVPLMLSDRIRIEPIDGDGADEVICERVEGPNLAAAALGALREAGWKSPPLRIEIEKRIPIAAGLGGGSADAAAVLRLAAGEVDGLERIAAALGADVTSQLQPEPVLVEGAGERLTPLAVGGEWAAVLIPDDAGLRTPDVFTEADRLGLPRPAEELVALREQLLAAASEGASPLDYAGLLVNDLGEAAISLRPEVGAALAALREAGAEHALVTGSGPTAVGLFADIAKADAGASALPLRYSTAIVTGPMTAPTRLPGAGG